MKTILYLRTDVGTRELTSGGSVTHTLGVLDGLLAQNNTIYCASSAMHSILANKKDMHFKSLWLPRLLQVLGFKISCLFSNIWFLIQTWWFVRSTPIDYIYQRYSMLNIVGIMLANIKKIPLVLEFNGSEAWVDAHWSPNKKLRANRLVMLFEKWNVTYADHIIVVSQVLKDMLVARGVSAQKILVNPNGVNVEQFDPNSYQHKAIELRSALGITDKYVFGFIGSFSYWHGIEIISAMIPEVVKRNSHAHFLLVGSGPLFEQCKTTIEHAGVSHAVTFVGRVPYLKAPEYLAVCDAFLCPSQPNQDGTPFFGSPTKLFEYMSMGKPIIASRVDQLQDIIDPSFGILVDHDDVEGFVVAAQKLMACDVRECKNMGYAAREKAVAFFSWQQHVRNISMFVNNEQCNV